MMKKIVVMSYLLSVFPLITMDSEERELNSFHRTIIGSMVTEDNRIELKDDIVIPDAPTGYHCRKEKEAFLSGCVRPYDGCMVLRPYNGATIIVGNISLAPYEYLKSCNVQSLDEARLLTSEGKKLSMFPVEVSINRKLTDGLMIGTILGRVARRMSSESIAVIGEKMRPDIEKKEEEEAIKLVGEELDWVEFDQLVVRPFPQGEKFYPRFLMTSIIDHALLVLNKLWPHSVQSVRTHLKEEEQELIQAYEESGFTKYEHQYMQDGLIVYHKKLQ